MSQKTAQWFRTNALRVLLISAALVANPASAQIINGSFESPPLPPGVIAFFPAGPTIPGWTVVGSDVALIPIAYVQGGVTFQAQSGIQSADLTGSSTSTLSGLRQLVPTVIGQAYDLQFYVGSANGAGIFFPATVDLSIDGGPRTSYFNPADPSNAVDWQLFSVQFTATSTMTSLTFFNGNAPNNFYAGLDNVSLTSIPEPSTLILAGLGAMGLGWRRWRKRTRAA